MTTRPPWACSSCVHLIRDDIDGRERICEAFPDEIPLEIWSGRNDHTQPFEGDQGIRYQKIMPEDLTASAFHLAGQHDQSTHGRGGVSGDAALAAAPVSIGNVVNYAPQTTDIIARGRGGSGIRTPDQLDDVSAAEYGALNDMRNYGHARVNDHLHGESMSASQRAKAEENTHLIDGVMHRSGLTEDVTVYRETATAGWLPRGGRGDLTGAEWSDKGFTTATAKFDLQYADPGQVRLAMHVPKGTGAVVMSDKYQEMLLDRGLRYRVRADHGVIDGVRHLDVDVI